MAGRTVVGYSRTNRFDPEIIRVEDAILIYTTQLTSNQLLAGAILGPFKLLSGVTTSISHGLGRPFVGWIVVDKDAQTDIIRDPAAPDKPAVSIGLQATSADVNVKLYVF